MDEYEYLFTGQGLLHLDIALALLAAAAATAQYWRIAVWKSTRCVLTGRWLMALGWTVISGRIIQMLWMTGDILISLPSLIAMIMLSSGSIMVALFWRPHHRGAG